MFYEYAVNEFMLIDGNRPMEIPTETGKCVRLGPAWHRL